MKGTKIHILISYTLSFYVSNNIPAIRVDYHNRQRLRMSLFLDGF